MLLKSIWVLWHPAFELQLQSISLEADAPESRVILRIRLAHRNTNQAILKGMLAKLESLTLNEKGVFPKLISVPSKRYPDSLEDQYYLFSLPTAWGNYRATVTARVL